MATLVIMRSTEAIFLARPEKPSSGIPLAVKDLFDTAGLATTYGSSIFAEHVPTETAEAVRRLEAAGYADAGKTNLHEFAYGVTSMNPHYGWVPNPVHEGRIAGGSSGGSAAALAAGLADAALGTDSGGSIRIPAAFCGIVGFKPTYGLVPLDGCWPLAPSYDHAGPMARSVADCVSMLEALVPEFEAAPQPPLDDLRVAVTWLDDADDDVRARVEAAAAHFPHRESIDFPRGRGNLKVFMREIAEVHATLFDEQPEAYGADVARKIRECLEVTDGEVAQAERVRESYRDEAAELLDGFDLLVTPTQGSVAPTYEEAAEDSLRAGITSFTNPFNALGWPALALPCGTAEHGLPASIQLVGLPGADASVLAAGAALEAQVRA
jgi:aspartyl-tRNA(Asn)/glutamyl-tRNA(Gln) amidotransferase subunit A